MRIVRLGAGDSALIFAAVDLFDSEPIASGVSTFPASDGHHLLLAITDDDRPVGFVTGVETTHPDKGAEMLLYELGVDPEHRRRGVGTALVAELGSLARGARVLRDVGRRGRRQRRGARDLPRRGGLAAGAVRHARLGVRRECPSGACRWRRPVLHRFLTGSQHRNALPS